MEFFKESARILTSRGLIKGSQVDLSGDSVSHEVALALSLGAKIIFDGSKYIVETSEELVSQYITLCTILGKSWICTFPLRAKDMVNEGSLFELPYMINDHIDTTIEDCLEVFKTSSLFE